MVEAFLALLITTTFSLVTSESSLQLKKSVSNNAFLLASLETDPLLLNMPIDV